MEFLKVSIFFSNEEEYNTEALDFSINIDQKDTNFLNISSFYNAEGLTELKKLVEKQVAEITVTNQDGEIVYTSSEWATISSLSVHYNNFYKKMVIDFSIES